MQMKGFTMGLTAGQRPIGASSGNALPITATLAPGLSALNASQTPAAGYSAGTYTSSAGTISSVVETYLVNGSAQSGGVALTAGDLVQVSVLVSDSAANSEIFSTAIITVTAASSATLSITASRGHDQVAPEGIWFEATPAGFDVSLPTGTEVRDPTFNDILYVWSFDDVGAFATAPVKILPVWDDRNIGYGRQVSHVFATPGSYDVTCTGYDRSGNIAVSNALSVVVKDPAVDWSGTKTICVALDGDYTGAPSGAQTLNTMAAAESAYKALGSAGRMLLKNNGDTYSFADGRVRDAYPNFHLGTFGTGPRASVDTKLWLNDMASSKDATLWGFDRVGDWDSTTETGVADDGFFIDVGRHFTVWDVLIDGCNESIQLSSTVTSGTYIHQEMRITNWKGYGVLNACQGTTKHGYKGCSIAQHVDALGGGKGKGTGHNEHGPYRWSAEDPGVVADGYFGVCDFFSNTGWTQVGGVPAPQPAWRISGGNNNVRINMERVSFEGDLAITDTAGGSVALPTNIIVDKCVVVGHYATQHNVTLGLGGTVVRNTAIIQPNVPSTQSTTHRSLFLMEDAGDDSSNITEEVQVINCSLVDLLDDTNDPNVTVDFVRWNGGGVFNTETFDNNIEHRPNSASATNTGDTPLDTTELWAARMKGVRWEDAPTLDTSYATPAGTVALYGAGATSAAENSATTGIRAIDDISAVQRSQTTSRGVSD